MPHWFQYWDAVFVPPVSKHLYEVDDFDTFSQDVCPSHGGAGGGDGSLADSNERTQVSG